MRRGPMLARFCACCGRQRRAWNRWRIRLLERRPEERILVVVLTGDRSLAGAFNTNVIRRATIFLRENSSKKAQVIAIGKKGRDTLRSAA